MGQRTSFPPGTFSWADLSTSDVDGAKAFYAGLFGWEAQDLPIGPGEIYSMQQVRGQNVAAISAQRPEQAQAGIPPLWNSYVTVADADATAARAAELGGTVHAPAFDVMDAGRMAVIADPQGAVFSVWQPKDNIGAQLVTTPGALCWNELTTSDPEGAKAFYTELLGWATQPMEGGPVPYNVIMVGERSNGGIMEAPDGVPTAWTPYFAVEDLDDALARVDELGGATINGPMEIPDLARIAVVRDPQGAVFALYAGRLDDD